MMCPFKPTIKIINELFEHLLKVKMFLSDESTYVFDFCSLLWLWFLEQGYSKDNDIFDFLQNENLLSEYFK